MAKIRTYKCPSCGGQFDFMHHPSDEPPPRFCPLCGFDTAVAEDDVIEFHPKFLPGVTAPHVRDGRAKAITQSNDQTYRNMEESTATNAQAAADMLGVPLSEMSDMKVTNAETSLRPGDLAVKMTEMPNNEVSQMVNRAPQLLGNQSAEVGRFFADSTLKTGPYARAGAKTGSMIADFHTRASNAIVKAGEQGRF